MLGLPDPVNACLFDLDGVLTDTASVHRAAWRRTFDDYLAPHRGAPFTDQDYVDYVDGKPRADGVRAFLASRGITLPEGAEDDRPEWDTVHGLGNRKNDLLLHVIHSEGVTVFDGSRRYLQAATDAGLRRAVVSSSANTADILHVTGLERLIEARVDGLSSGKLRGKPAPDYFLAAAALLQVAHDQAAVFEDATAGAQAGRAGGFGFVVGVNRLDAAHGAALSRCGADRVVGDLVELL